MYFNVFKGCGVESKMKEFQKHRANLLKRQNETLPIMLMFIGLKNEKKNFLQISIHLHICQGLLYCFMNIYAYVLNSS